MRFVLAAALIAYALLGGSALKWPTTTQTQSVQEPDANMKAQVQEVVQVVRTMNPVDRLWLMGIYSNAARVVRADGEEKEPVISSTESLRSLHVAVLKCVWKTLAEASPGKYPGLREAIEGVFVKEIGDVQRAMTPDLREKAAKMLDAIAWAGLGKDG